MLTSWLSNPEMVEMETVWAMGSGIRRGRPAHATGFGPEAMRPGRWAGPLGQSRQGLGAWASDTFLWLVVLGLHGFIRA